MNPDEEANADGNFVAYPALRECNPPIHDALMEIVAIGDRRVAAVEARPILPPGGMFYSVPLTFRDLSGYDRARRIARRASWVQGALDATREANVIFVDPDNGLPGKTASPTSNSGQKYVFPDELTGYIAQGQSVIVYLNVQGACGKRTIAPDPELSVFIRQLYERYATGKYSLKDVAAIARADGFTFRKSREPVNTSTIHKILRNRVYTGDFDFDGTRYRGNYEPIVPRELWQQVQATLNFRGLRNTRKGKHQFAFSGLITCGHCGCAMVGEVKKGRYIYYHCTGHKGKCPERYVREEVLEARFTNLIAGIVFCDEMLEQVKAAMCSTGEADRQQHEAAVRRLQQEHQRLQDRIEAMYVDKLDGRVEQNLYDRKAAEWRSQQAEVARQIQAHETPQADAVDVYAVVQRAVELFQKQPAREKRELLDFVVSRCSWKNGELTPEYRAPWGWWYGPRRHDT